MSLDADQLVRRVVSRQDAIDRRMAGYAAKFIADHDGTPPEPTDEALAVSLAGCVRPPLPCEYRAIRRAFHAHVTTHHHLLHLADRLVADADAVVAAWQHVLDLLRTTDTEGTPDA